MATGPRGERARTQRSEAARGSRPSHTLVVAALVLATFAVYAQVRNHAFLNFDDPDYVLQNPHLREPIPAAIGSAFREPYLGNWAPLTSLSLRLDYALYGLAPAGYLLTNVAWHALASVLLYLAFARMTGARGRSAFVAFVFALHPLHVESVAWASERKDVLAGAFFMLGLYAYASYAERPGRVRLLCVTACLTAGLLAKATLVSFPFVLLLLDVWPLGRVPGWRREGSSLPGVSWRRAWLEKLPMFVGVALLAAVTFHFQREAGSMQALADVSLGLRLRNALEAYVTYAASSFWPSGLAVFYPHAQAALPVWRSVASALGLAGVSLAVALSARARPYLAVGWLWYLGVLVPMLGIVQVGRHAHADRYLYLPQIGLSIGVAWGGVDALAKLRAGRLAAPAACAIVAALGLASWLQLAHWRGSIELFEHALAVTSHNAVAHLQLAQARLDARELDAAERHFAEAARIDPDWAAPRLGLADVRVLRGDLAGAIAGYQRELERNPNDALATGRYAFALLRAGRAAEARAPFERALTAHPGSAQLHAGLAAVYDQLGRREDAIRSNREALRLDARQLEAANNLAWQLATRAGATPEEKREAIAWAERASRAPGGENASVLDTLAVAYAAAGRFDDAIAASERALRAAEASGRVQTAAEIRARRALYASGRAWVEPPALQPPTNSR